MYHYHHFKMTPPPEPQVWTTIEQTKMDVYFLTCCVVLPSSSSPTYVNILRTAGVLVVRFQQNVLVCLSVLVVRFQENVLVCLSVLVVRFQENVLVLVTRFFIHFFHGFFAFHWLSMRFHRTLTQP